MNTVRRIAKNTGVFLASKIVSYTVGFFYIMYTARYLGVEGFGILSFALAFTGIFGIFTDIGLRNLTVREIARDKSLTGKYLGNIAVMKIFLSIITSGLIIITINILGYPLQTRIVVYLIYLSVIFGTFSEMFYSIFQAHEKMEYQSIGQISSSVLMLAGVLFAISYNLDIIGFAFIYFIANAIILGYAFTVSSRKFVLPKMEIDWGFWRATIKEALPFGFTGIFILIYFWIDTIMLSLLQGNEAVGLYNAAYRLITALNFIHVAFLASIYPIMSNFYIKSEKSLMLLYEKSLKYILIIAIPIGVGTVILAEKIIILIFGLEYVSSIIVLQILIWAEIMIFLSVVFGTLLNSTNKQFIVTKQTFIAAMLNVFINLLLIPKYSYIGASIATVLTEIFALIFLSYYVSRANYHSITSPNVLKQILKVSFASILMGVYIISFKNIDFGFLIISSMVIYFIILYMCKGIDKSDIKLINQLL